MATDSTQYLYNSYEAKREAYKYHKVEFDLNGGYLTGNSKNDDLDQRVEHGQDAKAPTCDHSGYYYFNGWNPEPKNITADTKCTARWRYNPPKPKYEVTWDGAGGKWSNGDTSKTYYVTEGNNSPNPGQPNPPEHKEFDYWDGNPNNVTSNRTITARWKDKLYEVVFDANGGWISDGQGNASSLDFVYVPYGSSASPDGTVYRPGYKFIGWSPSVSYVTGNMGTKAQWEKV